MRDLVILVVIGAGTYLMRGAFLLSSSLAPPAALRRLLAAVGPAVLAAITVPQLLSLSGTGSHPSGVSVPRAAAGVLAALVAGVLWRRSGSLPLALFGGLGAWWLAAAWAT